MLVNPIFSRPVLTTALAVLALGTSLGAALSSDGTVQLAALPPQAAGLLPGDDANGARPDVSALRYYARRGEQDRMQAEIRRLRALYPNWQQPENVFAEDGGEEKPFWKLLGEGKLAAVREALEARAETDPGFQPSAELIGKIEEREHRDLIAGAWARRDWKSVLAEADANPGLLLGDDVELIWFVGEAYAHLERPAEAEAAFEAALSVSRSERERKATLEKAAQLLASDVTLDLLEKSSEDITDPATRSDVEDALVRGALVRASERGEAPEAQVAGRIEGFARRAKAAGARPDILLLAWAAFGQRRFDVASAWFEEAIALKADAKAIEGAAMSALHAGRRDRAQALAREWKGVSPEIGALFINIEAPALLAAKPAAIDPGLLQDFAARSAALKSGEGAEALGWYAYNLGQLDAAAAWFDSAIAWEETETAVYGKALSAQRRRDRASFEAVKARFGTKYGRVAKLVFARPKPKTARVAVKRVSKRRSDSGSLRGRIARRYEKRDYAACLRMTRKLRAYGPLKAGDHQMRGWCLLGAKRPAEAERAFEAAVRLGGKGRVPSAYGQALAALRSGNTNQALAIANANPLTASQRRTVDVELLTQRARAAFANRDYAASIHALDERSKLATESRDLTLMRSWAHFHKGDVHGARDLFAMLDAQLSTAESRRGFATAKRFIRRKFSNDH